MKLFKKLALAVVSSIFALGVITTSTNDRAGRGVPVHAATAGTVHI